jgi:hypothetical protein
MTFTKHVSRKLTAYLDGKIAPSEAARIDNHLRECRRCQSECEEIRFAIEWMGHLSPVEAPDAIWLSIEAALDQREVRAAPVRLWSRWAFAAAFVLALATGIYWFARIPRELPQQHWEVVRLAGSPSVGAKPITGSGTITVREWIETDAGSRASIKVGAIGSLEVEPNTRLRVVTARPGEHRIALARGEIRAKISAPPRLFFVDTASGTAVDLGCEYSLNTDENGLGLLSVTKGWVSFEWNGLESLVPAGASCRTLPNTGPSLPYFDDASENLKQAVGVFGVEKAATGSFDVILSESRVRDTLTLWHLLWRVGADDRGRVFDRIAALTPIPAGVSREQSIRLDPETLKRLKDELAWTW